MIKNGCRILNVILTAAILCSPCRYCAAGDRENGHPVLWVTQMQVYQPKVVHNLGLIEYYDCQEALAASKRAHKPIFCNFTGINDVCSRKMETDVWSDPKVAKKMKNDFILLSLYCDIRHGKEFILPVNQQFYSSRLKAKVIFLGDKNLDFEMSKFNSESQPLYAFMDERGKAISGVQLGLDKDVDKFIKLLDKAKSEYNNNHHQ